MSFTLHSTSVLKLMWWQSSTLTSICSQESASWATQLSLMRSLMAEFLTDSWKQHLTLEHALRMFSITYGVGSFTALAVFCLDIFQSPMTGNFVQSPCSHKKLHLCLRMKYSRTVKRTELKLLTHSWILSNRFFPFCAFLIIPTLKDHTPTGFSQPTAFSTSPWQVSVSMSYL